MPLIEEIADVEEIFTKEKSNTVDQGFQRKKIEIINVSEIDDEAIKETKLAEIINETKDESEDYNEDIENEKKDDHSEKAIPKDDLTTESKGR